MKTIQVHPHPLLRLGVVDADLLTPPIEVRIADPGASYAFNPSGQEIDLTGLLCDESLIAALEIATDLFGELLSQVCKAARVETTILLP